MAEAFTLCVTGDIHLGRRPSRIPESLDSAAFSPRTVWRSTVDLAVDADVDAVVVTGDVVDRENRYFEAYGAFERGLSTLDDAGVPVVAVAGNHDFDVLPRLAAEVDVPGFSLLGADGDWERHTVTDADGDALVHLDGWSFQSTHELTSPLADYDPSALDRPSRGRAGGDAPVVGVLHADLDATDSDYAPVRTAALEDTDAAAWLLGHIHAPRVVRDADPFVCYPGSPQPLDPGEPGQHGPWLLEFDAAGRVTPTQHALATLRYDALDVDVAGATDAKSVPAAVGDAVETHVRAAVDTTALELLLARVRLTGRTDAHGDLLAERDRLVDTLEYTEAGVGVHVESLTVDTRPAVDLHALADQESPVGHLAALLLDLEEQPADGDVEGRAAGDDQDAQAPDEDVEGRGVGDDLDPEHDRLLEDAVDAMQSAANARAYQPLWADPDDRFDPPTRDDARATLARQARTLLDELLEQTEGDA